MSRNPPDALSALRQESRRVRQLTVSKELRRQLRAPPCAAPEHECKCEPCRLASCGKRKLVFSCDRQLRKNKVGGGRHEPLVIHRGCDRKWCPSCAPRLRRRTQAAAFAAVSHAMEKHPGTHIAHAVFTVPNTPDVSRESLRTVLANLSKWLRRVRQKDNVVGVWRSLEVTWSRKGGFHPHIHALLLLRTRSERRRLKWGRDNWGELERQSILDWHDLTGCSRKCELKAASLEDGKDKAGKGCALGGSLWIGDYHGTAGGHTEQTKRIVFEVAKYVSKGVISWKPDIPPSATNGTPYQFWGEVYVSPVYWKLIAALGGDARALRTVAGTGAFYGVKAPDDRPDPLICHACDEELLADPSAEYDGAMHCRGSPLQVERLAMKGCPDSADLSDWLAASA